MECDICGKHESPKTAFYCPTCARSAIYTLRIDHATALMHKEDLGRRVKAAVTGNTESIKDGITLDGALIDVADCHKTYTTSKAKAETLLIEDRIQSMSDKARELRTQIEEHKKKIAEMKTDNSRRKSDAESAQYGLDTRSTKQVDEIKKHMRAVGREWDERHRDLIQGRKSLCREAARLAGLHRSKVVEGQSMQEHYEIGTGLRVFDLREMNSVDPEILSASLTQVAFLLNRVAAYLAVRLPAELTLPHKDYPLPTIFSPASSYLQRDVPYPGLGPSHSSSSSPRASRSMDNRPLPRPRALATTRSLPQLQKEDPAAFSVFVEGVVLLAWDVAWLCKVQGMGGLNSWSDICPIGRNLYNLVLLDHRTAGRAGATKHENVTPGNGSEGSSGRGTNSVPLRFGKFSHGAAHSFLGSPEGTELTRNWRLQNPARAIDKIKAHLLGEMQSAEWDVVEEVEWHNETEPGEEPVVVGASGRRRSSTRKAEGQSTGKSGWTKIKPRNDEAPTVKSGSATPRGNQE